jgi:hypothetical protein
MSWLRLQTVFVVMLLVIAACQCVVACTAEPAHESPSCHRHQSKAPERCAHVTVLAEYLEPVLTSPELMHAMPPAFLPVQNVLLATPDFTSRAIPQENSPPPSPEFISSTILKI